MSKGYEERYLMTLLSAVMNQKQSQEPIRSLDWEKMYRLADYHHVAHAVYYGIMGLEEAIPDTIRERFFQKYLEAVHRTDRLQKSEGQILTLMERRKIPCFSISYTNLVQCYPIEEMCCRDSIEIGVSRKGMYSVSHLLQEVDFEEKQTDDSVRCYYRIPGIRVLNYTSTVFFSKSMRRFFKQLLLTLPLKKGSRCIRELTPDDQYLFLMCRLTDSYAKGNISLSQILDFWVFYKKYAESFKWPYIYGKLKKLKIAEFAERLEYLILRWFGTGVEIENMEIYDAMESYILSKGTEGREISSKFLPLIKTVADCYARNRRMEHIKKLVAWFFPDRRYMETIYPILGKIGFLLPVFWGIRLLRYMGRIIPKIKIPDFRVWLLARRERRNTKDQSHLNSEGNHLDSEHLNKGEKENIEDEK